MAENFNGTDHLNERLEALLKRQEIFSKEINELKKEIDRLKISGTNQVSEKKETTKISPDSDTVKIISHGNQNRITQEPYKSPLQAEKSKSSARADLEKFIGENLINKIGIVITVIGVAIGAKYAIDHQLISPLARILSGYIFGIVLLVFAIRLKKAYENFSAVLLSGSMAIMYFLTYSAYTFYALIPQSFTFILMVFFTGFTVTAAIKYNRQVIAHIGLVGAYAVPFLLSEGSGNVKILFTYTAIINVGILIISFKKYWKTLYYSSFLLTWLMYLMWFGSEYKAAEHFGISTAFLLIFFVTFYLMFLAYKLIQQEKFNAYDIVLVLANSFIFYGAGCSILTDHYAGKNFLGLFTFCNALLHLIVSLIIYRKRLADRNLFYLISGLALIFITISIPVQLSGNRVTLLWAGEATLLFWIGRARQVKFYEIISYALIFLAFTSLLQDWSMSRYAIDNDLPVISTRPIFNAGFLTSLLFIISIGFINYLNYDPKYPSPYIFKPELKNLISFLISGVLVIVLYFSFQVEISAYWNQLYNDSLTEIQIPGEDSTAKYHDDDLLSFRNIWLINYSFLFLSVFSFFNIKRLRSRTWGNLNLYLNTILIMVFLLYGLYILSELRETYLDQTLSEYYHRGIYNIVVRYISLLFAALMFASVKMYTDQTFMKPWIFNLNIAFDILLYISVIWILSSELLSWMDIFKYSQSYKLALSILWGVYALFLIIIGIWKMKQHLRVIAIALFAVTLLKLFSYDLSHLNTISKTIVFITLGVLLLIISFLYNKYKNIITGQPETGDQ